MAKPKIRFNGYTEDWEQRKLGKLYQRNTERNENLIGYDKTISVATMSYKDDGNGASESSLSTYKVLRVGDIAFEGHTNKQFRFGRFVVNDIGTGIMSPRFSTLRPLNEMPVNFWKQYIHSESVMRRILVNSTKAGTMMNELVIPEFLNQTIMVPSENEQAVIGQYFTNLDHLITLHQRKCEQTKTLKKYMLQKMFPQDGEKVPQIRFEGFTEDWEQRKFGEIVEKYEDPVETPTEGYTRLGIRSHAKGTFHSYVEKGKELETAKMFRVAADKFIVNITFGWEHAVAITDENDAGKLVSHRFPQYSFNAGMEPKFFRYLILDENFKHHLELSSPGGAGRNRVLKLSDMLQYKMNFPSEAEQKKIAAYFDDLDTLITLHQRKCDELKEVKKFMLQNIFV